MKMHMNLKLTEEELLELESKAKDKEKAVTKQYDVSINYESLQDIIDQADHLIKAQPHLTYKDLELDYDGGYDGSRDYHFEYKTSSDWKPVYEEMCISALLNKEREYSRYLKLKDKFEYTEVDSND